ncbi:MAG: hypothetical protein RRY40_02760, partial [Oscillospiraceae bacterium]
MLSPNFTLFFLFISAMVTENLIFARATGIDEIVGRARNNSHIVIYSVLMFFIAFPSILMISPIKTFLTDYWHSVRGIIVAVAVSVCCFTLSFIGKKYKLFEKIGFSESTILAISFNCTTFAIVLFSIQESSLFNAIIYCGGACVGVM